MTIRIEVRGLDQLKQEFTNIAAQFDEVVSDAIEETTLEIRNRVQKEIQRGQKTGRIYDKTNPNRTHQASAPGEAPATDTGRLVGSIYFDIDPKSATVGSRLAYAAHLEFGTRKMKARPVWVRVAKDEEGKMRERIVEGLQRVTR